MFNSVVASKSQREAGSSWCKCLSFNLLEEPEHSLSCDHNMSVLFTLGWFVRSLGTCCSGGGVRVVCYWCHLEVGLGGGALLPDVQSIPSPSRRGWAQWASCVATKASGHQGQAEGYAVRVSDSDSPTQSVHGWIPHFQWYFLSVGCCNFRFNDKALVRCILHFELHVTIRVWGLQTNQEKVSGWGTVVLLTQTGTVQRLWTARSSLVSALILDTHCNSGPSGLQ